MSKKNDIGLVIGTKEHALWIEVRDATKKRLASMEESFIIDKALLEMAIQKIKDEEASNN